jgi:hypothetical protein
MRARFYDGLTAQAHDIEVAGEDDALSFTLEGQPHRWPLSEVEAEALGDRVRLGRRGAPARLVIAKSDWAALQPEGSAHRRRIRRAELWLVGGLTAAAIVVAGVVFVGIPVASGPLARATPPEYERQMGESFALQLRAAFKPCPGKDGQAALDGLARRLKDVSTSPFDFQVQAVRAPMVNAFALPGGTILVTDDLIDLAETPDELAAVLAHEAAHVEKRHVMQAVWRSLGLGLILDAVVGGGSGAGQQAVLLAGSFTDLRYSRDAELEADAEGQALLKAAGLSSSGMAPFFRRLKAEHEGDGAAVAELISSHPDTQRRAKLAEGRAHTAAPAFSAAEWTAIKATCPAEKRKKRSILRPFG